ncbi:MAG TPA: putative porin [Verrucomicrobiota bacterium]|nr:putative porin [Verrucomicrobiota bacterium]HRZ36118.1 putative porin [Candidatus Paceibacterota bacterium]HRZ56813.1 putative porin [Candidatus Paceibacterota bacterium]
MRRTNLCTQLLGIGVAIAGLSLPAARTQSSDALIDKLVEKGILTVKEGNELREEADKGFGQAYAVKSGMPEWVTALKINGDFRGRFEGFYGDNPDFVDRNRWRYRLRLGVAANLIENLEVGVRLGSGDLDNASGLTSGSDPISNNQSLQNNASKKGIFLDLAYARWAAINRPDWTGVLTIGKMENPFVLSDMLFDNDYTPEGAAQQISYTLNDRHALKLNLGEFVLDEIGSTSSDPFLLGSQLRLESVWTPKVGTSAGIGFLTIQNEENLPSSAVPDINAGNRRHVRYTGNSETYAGLDEPESGYDTLVVDAAFTYTLGAFPFYAGPFPIRVFGEYLYNSGADDMNRGYQAGVTFGKAGKRRTWELTYRYKVLEGDAWWEELTDSDFGAYYANSPAVTAPEYARARSAGYWAGTNARGHVVKASYSPLDPLTLSMTWFGVDLIEEYLPGSDSHMHRLQVDAVLKF